jgi:hypothetical protein
MSIEVPSHQQIWELLPWVINGTATPEQHEQVQAHLSGCSDCREEFSLQSLVHDDMQRESVPGNPHAGFQRLLQRLDVPSHADAVARRSDIEGDVRPATPVPFSFRRPWLIGIAALLLMQSAAITLMAVQLQTPAEPAKTTALPAAYETLSSADPVNPIATIRFVPAPQLSVGEMQKILDDAGVRIVDSRVGTAIYGLAPVAGPGEIDANSSTTAIMKLRGKPGVLLVEPVATLP